MNPPGHWTGVLQGGFLLLALLAPAGWGAESYRCTPTPWAEIGPFYRPGAPVRSSIGKGYELSGTVRSARDCSPVANARIEVWQVGPDGRYDDDHRATIYSGADGRYRLQTSLPPPYGGGRPHIHFVVDARGYDGVITQHYPLKGAKRAGFDLVLLPETAASGSRGRDPLGRPR
mgnify:CR=1 FL=1